MPPSFTRTLKFKVRSEAYGWLDAAAIEVNQVFNYANEASWLAATRTDLKRKWLSGFDLCNLTSGSARYFERIGADTIQRVCTEYAQKRVAAKRRPTVAPLALPGISSAALRSEIALAGQPRRTALARMDTVQSRECEASG